VSSAGETRTRQRLDIEQHDALRAYLRIAGYIEAGESPRFTTLPGGVSSRTVLVERQSGEDWVIKQSLAKLRVDVEWYSDPVRIHREAAGIRWLRQLAPPGCIPDLVFEDDAQHLLAMEAVPRPHANWKNMLLGGNIDPDHVRQFGEMLGVIHRRASQRQDDIAGAFDDRTFFESLRVEPYYVYTAVQVAASAAFMARLVESVRSRRLTLVHGDYSPKNVLVYGGRLVLLDHEVAHFGDPAFDLGFSLAHFLSKAHHLASHRGEFAEAASRYWEAYRSAVADREWASDLESHAVRNALGCALARVAGRSRLEYLSEAERARQRDVVLGLMERTPSSVREMVVEFTRRL
jgi:tRNA A-37 threonylcarbamoyl transferase component Bud32